YLTLANDAVRAEPYAIVRIEDAGGDVVWEPDRPAPEEGAIDQGYARAVTYALRGVVEGGTGTAADIGRPAAGKTGTTQDNVDAWFAGYVPGYAAVVWMGYPEPAPMEDYQGRSVTGGSFPAQIWSRFMTAAMEGRDVEDFPAPPEELLRESEPASLSVTPPEVQPGGTINVTGTGFGFCRAAWSVVVEGTPLASPPDTGSDAEDRSASIRLPDDIAPGDYQVVASCDSGAGAREAARAGFRV